jgi:hypothetical protein
MLKFVYLQERRQLFYLPGQGHSLQVTFGRFSSWWSCARFTWVHYHAIRGKFDFPPKRPSTETKKVEVGIKLIREFSTSKVNWNKKSNSTYNMDIKKFQKFGNEENIVRVSVGAGMGLNNSQKIIILPLLSINLNNVKQTLIEEYGFFVVIFIELLFLLFLTYFYIQHLKYEEKLSKYKPKNVIYSSTGAIEIFFAVTIGGIAGQILLDIFIYWTSKGEVPKSAEAFEKLPYIISLGIKFRKLTNRTTEEDRKNYPVESKQATPEQIKECEEMKRYFDKVKRDFKNGHRPWYWPKGR